VEGLIKSLAAKTASPSARKQAKSDPSRGDSLILGGPGDAGYRTGAGRTGGEHLRQGVRVVDFRNVTEVDSAAVALALEWAASWRRRQDRAAPRNLPAAMENLAKLYGVSELFQSASG